MLAVNDRVKVNLYTAVINSQVYNKNELRAVARAVGVKPSRTNEVTVARIKQALPTRKSLVGTVQHVRGDGTITVTWDNGNLPTVWDANAESIFGRLQVVGDIELPDLGTAGPDTRSELVETDFEPTLFDGRRRTGRSQPSYLDLDWSDDDDDMPAGEPRFLSMQPSIEATDVLGHFNDLSI